MVGHGLVRRAASRLAVAGSGPGERQAARLSGRAPRKWPRGSVADMSSRGHARPAADGTARPAAQRWHGPSPAPMAGRDRGCTRVAARRFDRTGPRTTRLPMIEADVSTIRSAVHSAAPCCEHGVADAEPQAAGPRHPADDVDGRSDARSIRRVGRARCTGRAASVAGTQDHATVSVPGRCGNPRDGSRVWCDVTFRMAHSSPASPKLLAMSRLGGYYYVRFTRYP